MGFFSNLSEPRKLGEIVLMEFKIKINNNRGLIIIHVCRKKCSKKDSIKTRFNIIEKAIFNNFNLTMLTLEWTNSNSNTATEQ